MTLKTFSILVILALLTWGGVSYYKYMNKPNQTMVDSRLEPYLDEWKTECEKYGIDYKVALNRILEIKMVDHLDAAGRADKGNRTVLVNIESVGEDPWLIRAVLWHELGHYVFNLNHNDDGLMYEDIRDSSYYEGLWEGLKASYFNTIVKKLILNGHLKQFRIKETC